MVFGQADKNGAMKVAEATRSRMKRLQLQELRPVFTDAHDGTAAFNFTDSRGREFRIRVSRYK